MLAKKHLAEKHPITISAAPSPAQRGKIISRHPSSSNTGERVLIFRCLPEQGLFFPVFTWHGISQRKWVALLGLCQLSYTIQMRFTLWSNQSGGWGGRGVCKGNIFLYKTTFLNKWVDYPRQSHPRSWRQYIHSVVPLPLPYQATGDYCSVAMATLTNWQPDPSLHSLGETLWDALGKTYRGDLHPRSHFFLTLVLTYWPRERENHLCKLSEEKPKQRQGTMSGEWALI